MGVALEPQKRIHKEWVKMCQVKLGGAAGRAGGWAGGLPAGPTALLSRRPIPEAACSAIAASVSR